MSRTKPSAVVLARLRASGWSLPLDAQLEPTRYSKQQKEAGAFYTFCHAKSKPLMSLGSFLTIREMYACKNLTIKNTPGDMEIVCGCAKGQGCYAPRPTPQQGDEA